MRNWIKQIFSTADKNSSEVVPVQVDDGSSDKEKGDIHLQTGNFAAAEQCYRQAIAVNPKHAKAHNNLAFTLKEQGFSVEAQTSLERALDIDPTIADAHYLLATLLQAQGQSDDAATHFRRALELAPDFEFAYRDLAFLLFQRGQLHDARQMLLQGIAHNPQLAELHVYLSSLHQEEGQFDSAIASLQQALLLQPERADILASLGLLLHKQNQLEQAVLTLQRAVALNPHLIDAFNNLGNALIDLKRFDEAATSYRLALQINPEFAELHNNLGNALIDLGKLDDAIVCFRKALEIAPGFADAHSNLGSAFKSQGKLTDAVACYRQALLLNPNYAEGHSNLGSVLQELGQLDDAVSCYQQALTINPDHAQIHNNLGGLYTEMGQLDEALASFRRALKIDPYYFGAHSGLLFIYNYVINQPAITMVAEAQHFGNLANQKARAFTNWANTPDVERCLRVGLVSGDLRNHPVGYFLENVLKALVSNASGRLEFFGYSNHASPDIITERIKACCHHWNTIVNLSDEVLAKRIRDDGIDILIDLSGHSARTRLPMFAWKPAPIQVNWLGYFATTGMTTMDYLIADPWTVPITEEIHFSEKIWRLPETRLCFSAPDIELQVSPLPALINGYITFACFNNLTKMNDAVVALWAKVLTCVPKSRLFLKSKQLEASSVRNRTIERFAAHGVAADRLILEGHSPRAQYLAAYHRVDIALDPFPFTGGTTTVEALWMGVPVLTLTGESFISRQGVGLMMNAELFDWVATYADDYVTRAMRHAEDIQDLAILRSGLREQVLNSPIFDAQRFAHHFEAALRDMWTKWCNEQRNPHTIEIKIQ